MRTVYHTLLAAARPHADRPAVQFQERSLTYAELTQQVDHAARHLRQAGVDYGKTFAVYAQNRPEFIIAYYAAARIGAILVPINPNMAASEVAHVVSHCDAELLYHDDLVADAAAALTGLRRLPIAMLAEPCDAPDAGEDGRIRPDDDFVIVYTSGSTGAPKAIVLDHHAQVGAISALAEMWGITDRDVTLVGLPMGYLYGLSTAAATGLLAGGKVVVLKRFHPGEVLAALLGERASIYHGVPTMFTMMLDYAEQRGLAIDLSGVRALICAGAPLSEELKQRFARTFNKDIQNYYALSECTPVFGTYAGDPAPVPAGAAGKLAPGARARIVDETGQDCPVGIAGELLVRGAATLKRYHKEPGLTAAAFHEGLFRTGDLACRDAEGFYTITGRIKDIIIRGGANIAPAEVESVLTRHAAVQDAAVVGAPDKTFGEVPVAFVVCRAGQRASAGELIAYAEQFLADFKTPRTIHFLDAMPLGKTGKVDKAALKARLAAASR